MPKTRWIHSLWAGVDGVLSNGLCARTDVILTNAKHAFSESLGEYAILGALHFAKRVPHGTQQYREKIWQKYQVKMLKGYVRRDLVVYAHMFGLKFGQHLPCNNVSKTDTWPYCEVASSKSTYVLLRHSATMCIVGYGSIGAQVARRAHALDMQVLAVKRDPNTVDEDTKKFVHKVYGTKDLPEILPNCDYVVCHLLSLDNLTYYYLSLVSLPFVPFN